MNDPRDEELSHVYREGAWPAPSRQIDDAILAASRRAVRARHPFLWRWAPPLALAATVVLTFTLVLRVYEERPEERIATASPAAPSVPGAEKPAAPAAKEETAAAPPQVPPAPESSPVSALATPAPALKKQAPEAARTDRARSALQQRLREGAPPSQGQPSENQNRAMSAPVRAGESPPPVTSPAAPAPGVAGLPGAATEAAASGIVNRRSDAPERTPQAWLEDIRALRTAGKAEEAERELAEFRKRYPEYRLPDDLR